MRTGQDRVSDICWITVLLLPGEMVDDDDCVYTVYGCGHLPVSGGTEILILQVLVD